jgi:hypothetical protein
MEYTERRLSDSTARGFREARTNLQAMSARWMDAATSIFIFDDQLTAAASGSSSAGPWSHSDTPWYVSLGVFHTQWAKRRLNDATVHG